MQIDTTLQAVQNEEGVSRVSIDNTRRGEVLLVPGIVARTLRIPLTPEALGKSVLNVSFSLVGTGAIDSRASDDDLGAIAEIDASSSLVMTLDTPVRTVPDPIRAWGNDVRIAWDANESNAAHADQLAQAAMLIRAAFAVSFAADDGLDGESLAQITGTAYKTRPTL